MMNPQKSLLALSMVAISLTQSGRIVGLDVGNPVLVADAAQVDRALISAAALAFGILAVLGCNGDALVDGFQVEYEQRRLPGPQRFFYSPRNVATERGAMDLRMGVAPDRCERCQTRAFDGQTMPLETRVVRVNGRLVGALCVLLVLREARSRSKTSFESRVGFWNG